MADNALTENGLPTLAEVCESPDDFLGKLDVGALNLLCATGLPSAENLDVGKLLDWLDNAAHEVDLSIRRHRYRLENSPSIYNNSPGYFCCYHLLQTLQEKLGVKYNPARITDSSFQNPLCINPDFRDSRDLFIHGMIDGPGGTCASMPVLYVAVGRRLGYPLKLVEAPGHYFVRWEDLDGQRFGLPERFNIEGAGEGIGSYPDDFYRTWPREWKPYDEPGGWYLKSLSPVEELACFLATRGSCLEDNGRLKEALQVFGWATKLLPHDLRYGGTLVRLMQRDNEMVGQALESERRMLATERIMFEQQQRQTGPPHGDSCQCRQCRQARQPVRQMPGHRPGCPCPMCK